MPVAGVVIVLLDVAAVVRAVTAADAVVVSRVLQCQG